MKWLGWKSGPTNQRPRLLLLLSGSNGFLCTFNQFINQLESFFLIAFKFMKRFHNRHNASGARKHELHWHYETIKWLDWAVWTCGCAVVMHKWNEACSKVKRCFSCFSDINAEAHWTQECRASMKHVATMMSCVASEHFHCCHLGS